MRISIEDIRDEAEQQKILTARKNKTCTCDFSYLEEEKKEEIFESSGRSLQRVDAFDIACVNPEELNNRDDSTRFQLEPISPGLANAGGIRLG